MSKPVARRVSSDDCAVSIDGVVYYPHESEWVNLMGGLAVGELKGLGKFGQIQTEMDAIRGDANEGARVLAILNPAFDEVRFVLARHVTAWNWTDNRGQALPPPDFESLGMLSQEELFWLLAALQNRTPDAEKNASPPSPIMSLDTPSPETAGASSTGGLSLTQVS